jgi:hypothetical protein
VRPGDLAPRSAVHRALLLRLRFVHVAKLLPQVELSAIRVGDVFELDQRSVVGLVHAGTVEVKGVGEVSLGAFGRTGRVAAIDVMRCAQKDVLHVAHSIIGSERRNDAFVASFARLPAVHRATRVASLRDVTGRPARVPKTNSIRLVGTRGRTEWKPCVRSGTR